MNSESLHTNYEPAQEAIALLIDMAKRGEIDPWDVQVIDVIDRCLDALAEYSKTHSGTFEADLSQSGQAFLYASMLVLLKADTLFNYSSVEVEPEVIDVEEENLEILGGELPPYLERHLRRRPTAQPLQKRPVTLQDLISQLQQIAAELETKAPRVRPKRVSAQVNKQTAQAIADLAHQENLTETASELHLFLHSYWTQMSLGQDWLALEQLIQLWTKVSTSVEQEHATEIDTSEHQVSERVGVFWALLLLSAQSKVELSQEEFYQDLNIRILVDEPPQEVRSTEHSPNPESILPRK